MRFKNSFISDSTFEFVTNCNFDSCTVRCCRIKILKKSIFESCDVYQSKFKVINNCLFSLTLFEFIGLEGMNFKDIIFTHCAWKFNRDDLIIDNTIIEEVSVINSKYCERHDCVILLDLLLAFGFIYNI